MAGRCASEPFGAIQGPLEGPILAQDIARVTHNDTPESMEQKGREIERRVLSRAVKAHASGRAFLLGDRTVVFEH